MWVGYCGGLPRGVTVVYIVDHAKHNSFHQSIIVHLTDVRKLELASFKLNCIDYRCG